MKTFDELDLISPLQRAVADEKYTTPTPIQAQTIPAALEGKDVLGCAQTGTGKTAAFALPILNRLGKENRKAVPNRPFALILSPTRELAVQIGDSFETYGKHLHLRQVLVYGGVSQMKQVRSLKRGSHILIATPGRLLDLMNQGHIKLDELEVFVLDEADRMLDMGFLPDLKRIISKLPAERQSLFFSATMPPKITELSQDLLQNPVSVNVTPKTTSLETIEQQVLYIKRSGKQSLLRKILESPEMGRAIVFTKTKRGANMLADNLAERGFRATAIHGNKSQAARQRALNSFRANKVNVLVATDVAARGIDIDGITHVVNFDLPMEPENYVHRIGRTGRAGATGIALSFCCDGERNLLRSIEHQIGQRIPVGKEDPPFESQKDKRTFKSPRKPYAGEQRSAAGDSGFTPSSEQKQDSSAKKEFKPRQKRRRNTYGNKPVPANVRYSSNGTDDSNKPKRKPRPAASGAGHRSSGPNRSTFSASTAGQGQQSARPNGKFKAEGSEGNKPGQNRRRKNRRPNTHVKQTN